MSLIPLAVIAFSTTAALLTEFLQWFFVWRTPGFVTLKNNLSKHEKLVDDAKETSTTKNLKKKEQRLQTWRTEAGRQMASYNMKASVVLMVCVLVTYKVMTRLFSQIGPVGRLPFEPPPFLQKVTHRGLDASADARDCSAVFIFVLCQGSVRMVIGKLLNLGMGREFKDIMPTLPKGFPSLSMDDKKAK
ncbi:Calcium load-activated calcium channel [Chlorella vulgaris]